MLLNNIMNRVMVPRLDSGNTVRHTQGQEDEIQALSTIRKNLVPQCGSRARPFCSTPQDPSLPDSECGVPVLPRIHASLAKALL
mmetsp:Transcript_5944/g.36827  ORF Transcript_5944/g.36827 Transcript_5944/m.36827 type:complete len:84 (-) Transcript_5944:2392-2643(-)